MIELLVIAGCLCLLVASMALLSVCRERGFGSPEAVRKALHVEMGLLAVSAPWLFDSPWQIVVLAILASTLLQAVRVYRPLRRRMGGVLHDVSRSSRGEQFFVAGVVVTFFLSAGETAYYCSAILVMTLADTAAAVVGRRFGRHRYGAVGARKSLEGSSAFFFVAFACTVSVLAASSSAFPAVIVGAGLTVAFVTTVLEAMAGDGMDNLLIPVGALGTLQLYLGVAGTPMLGVVTVSTTAIIVLWSSRVRVRATDALSRESAQ